jgi:exonuclease SbcC
MQRRSKMILERLLVRAFRGITNELDFDLTARLTIIYGPNGTGKTSICDAVEWLLTGEVARFREALGTGKDKGLENLFTPELPWAEGNLKINEKFISVRRDNGLGKGKIRISEGLEWKEKPLNYILEQLTPKTLPPTTKGLHRVNSRRNWLRAVRFLEAHAINLLLDSDEKGNEVRNLVFNDLLGVGELQRQELEISRILKAYTTRAKLNREIRDTKEKLANIKKEIQAEVDKTKRPLLQSFQKLIIQAADRIKLKEFPDVQTDELLLSEVQKALQREQYMFQKRSGAFNYVSKNASLYETLNQEIEMLTEQQQEVLKKRKNLQEKIEIVNDTIQQLETKKSKASEMVFALKSLSVNDGIETFKSIFKQWSELGGDPDMPVNLKVVQSELSSLYDEYTKENDRLDAASQCELELPLWKDAQNRKLVASKRRKDLKLPNKEEWKKTEDELSKAQSEFNQLNNQCENLKGPLFALREAGLAFIEDAETEHSCPLCQHDHGSSDDLSKAIKSGIEAFPNAIETLIAKKWKLEKRINGLRQKFNDWNRIREEVESSNSEITAAQRILEKAEPLLNTIGFNIKELTSKDVDKKLRKCRSTIETKNSRTKTLMKDKERQVKVTQQLLKSAADITSLFESVRELSSDNLLSITLTSLPPSLWLKELESAIEKYQTIVGQTKNKDDELQGKIKKKREEHLDLKEKYKALEVEVHEIAKRVGTTETQIRKFEDQWESLTGNKTYTTGMLEQHHLHLERMKNEIETAEHELKSAKTILAEVRETENLRRERANRHLRLSETQLRLRELENEISIRKQCEKGLSNIRAAKDAFVAQQIQPLCDVITALYVRAQSNAFINRIDTSVDEGPLRWVARIGEHTLENTVQMSLGQRQDLALSIFLARARELGGTFFLDEPLLHLDDLNRVALLDILRTIVVEEREFPIHLVITTANKALVRHCQEKFKLVEDREGRQSICVYRLFGSPQTGISKN